MGPAWLAWIGAARAGGWVLAPGPSFEDVPSIDTALQGVDVDRDGVADLVLRGGRAPLATVWLRGLGDGLDDARPVPDADGFLAAADVDGDGWPDLLTEAGWVRNDRGAPRGLRRFDRPFAAADLDGDGLTDLLTLAKDTLGWHRGLGAARFGPWEERWTARPSSLNAALAADLDGDGDPDLVGFDTTGPVKAWENQGGALAAPKTLWVGSGLVRGLATDLDADGDPDLLLTASDTLAIAWNDGGWTWRLEALEDPGVLPIATPADLDGDGDLDLAVATDTLTRRENQGGGRFGPPEPLASLGGRADGLVALDVDRDGAVDLAVWAVEGFDERRLWWARNPAPPGAHPWTTPVAPVLDADGDGLPDAAPADPDPTDPDVDGDGVPDGVERGCGRDPFGPDPDGDCDGDGLSDAAEVAAGSPVSEADLDADGLTDPDEAALGTDPWTWDSDRGGRSDGSEAEAGSDPAAPRDDWPARNLLRTTGASHDTAVVGRIAGDFGDVRIVQFEVACDRSFDHRCEGWSGRAWMFDPPARDRHRPPAVAWTLPLRPDGFVGATAGDFDGDGDLDPLVAAETPWGDDERLWVRWTGPAPVETREPLSSLSIRAVAAADLDGDGIDDLLLRDGAGGTSWLRATGAGPGGGAFAPPEEIWPALPEQAADPWYLPDGRHLQVADLDGDGLEDLLLTSRARGGLAWLPRRTDGGWDPPILVSLARALPHAEAGDVDGDGIVDLVVAGEEDPAALLRGLGGGAFAPPVDLPLGGPTGLFDADGDGDLDLVGWDQDRLGLSHQGAAGVFGPSRELDTERRPNAPAAAPIADDVDGDGDLDLIVGGVDGWVLGNLAVERLGPSDPVAHTDGRGLPTIPAGAPGPADPPAGPPGGGCGCGPTGAPGGAWLMLVGLAVRRRIRPRAG